MELSRLTTTDNPHDPFDDYPAWYQYDTTAGYHTSGMLARILADSYDLSDADQEKAIELAIDEIVRENVLGIYRKVTRKDPENS